MRISIVGSGYVGLTTALGFAATGNQVICVDTNEHIIEMVNNSVSPIFEPGFEDAFKNAGANIEAKSSIVTAVEETDITVIAVGTPFDGTEIDLSQITQVSKEIGRRSN